MTTQPEDTFDGNPSPPRSKTVIKENFVGDIDASQEAGMQERMAEKEVALNKDNLEKNPSPPRADTTIGDA